MDEEKKAAFQQRIIDYWWAYGRHKLAWRQTTDPWKILLAEVLLRKTTSIQAEDVFNKLSRFTADDIKQMRTEQLEADLYPLGMSKVRAEQLQQMAARVKDANLDQIMSDDFLRSMPGVGRYISNSVRCCAFGIPAPALDTNMIRVVERVFGWKSERTRAREDKKFWQFAETLVPENHCREYNWGVLDFGAAVCTFRNPKCDKCPLQNICNYYQTNVET
ncbi:MAG: A/G-specific adenine glycosylase [Anaerolineae bacterium]|nr:A/G-specific adenine glycosylase [Anaerolineae bacterium]